MRKWTFNIKRATLLGIVLTVVALFAFRTNVIARTPIRSGLLSPIQNNPTSSIVNHNNAKVVQDISALTIADCKDENYIQSLINALQKRHSNGQQQSTLTALKCQLYRLQANRMSASTKESELRVARSRIYSNNRFSSPYDEYIYNFKAFILHYDNENAPIELYGERMHAIVNSLGKNDFLYEYTTYLLSERTVFSNQFKLSKKLNKEMLEILKTNASKLSTEEYDKKLYRVMMRLMICIFETEHRVDGDLLSKCQSLNSKYIELQQSTDPTLAMYPLYKAFAENRYNDALQCCADLKQAAEKRGFQYLFESDAAVSVCWRSGHLDFAIRISDMQSEFSKEYINQLDENYLREMGLDEELQSADRRKSLLMMEEQIGNDKTKSTMDELEALRNQLHKDSLLIAEELADRKSNLLAEEEENERTKKWAQYEHERLHDRIKLFAILLGIAGIVFLAIIIPYAIRIRRINRNLLEKHRLLRIATDQANQSNKLKVYFLQNTSHDIRNPLGAIGSFCQMLTSMISKKNDEEAKEYAHIVNENTSLLTRMMDSILDISSLESGRRPIQWQDTYPIGIAQELILIRQTAMDKPVEVKLERDIPEDYKLRSDAGRLKQLLSALLSNACKFTEKGHVKVKIGVEGNDFIMEVEDTGMGIPEDKTEEIFKRFVKIDQFMPGTGLGLSLCKVISENLMGNLYVDKTYKEGARIVFTQPLNAETLAKEKGPSSTNIYE